VVSRHPVEAWWAEIARVLQPGGVYFSQQVGPDSGHEVSEYFLGPFPWGQSAREPELARQGAENAGLEVVDLRAEDLRMEFFDVGAMVYYLRKVIWMVPDFSVAKYHGRLRELHEEIQAEGSFVATVRRFLIEAHKPLR
jgi:SAM-dependent methyltransferase